jgi:uncharacterized protein (TIGR02611 family)
VSDPIDGPASDQRRVRRNDVEAWRAAARAAEEATGRRERTRDEAKRNIIIRLVIIVAGFVVLLAGLVALVLPGPGLLLIIVGLGILAQELAWAERMLEYAKKKAKLDELKKQPAWIRVAVWVLSIAAVAASVTFVVVT